MRKAANENIQMRKLVSENNRVLGTRLHVFVQKHFLEVIFTIKFSIISPTKINHIKQLG